MGRVHGMINVHIALLLSDAVRWSLVRC